MSMTTCPNCGVQVAADDRFCSNCGARIQGQPSTDTPATPDTTNVTPEPADPGAQVGTSQEPVIPTLSRRNTWEQERDRVQTEASDDEWRMSDLGPPPTRKRRTWLWIVIGLLALMVIACCVFLYWVGYTDGGQEWFEGIATEAAEAVQEATRQASATPES